MRLATIEWDGSTSYGPCGPWVVTADEIADPQCLGSIVELRIEGIGRLWNTVSGAGRGRQVR